MADDTIDGNTNYILFDSLEQHGYTRIVDLWYDPSGEDMVEKIGVIDILVPRDLSDLIEDIASFAKSEEYDRLFLNPDIPWVQDHLLYADIEKRILNIPLKNVTKHFESGINSYNLVDILSEDL